MSQTSRDTLFIPQDNRANFKNVIAKRSDLARFGGGRMVATGADVVYEAGTVIGMVTASKLLKPYNAANVDGSEVPVGILSEQVSMDANGNGSECAYLEGGTLYKDMLIGLDANAISLLNARVSVEHGENLLHF